MKKITLFFVFSICSFTLHAQFPCQAAFNHYIGMNGTQFYDASLAQPTSWNWNFGDGSTDTAKNPLHQFTLPGTYYVCLIISDGAFCTDTACDSVTVTSTPGGGGNCTAGFNSYPGGTGNTVTFGNTSIPQSATWFWDFGDGTTDTAMGPTHNFPSPGSYYVCLTMTDSTGCKDTLCDTVVVNSGFPTGQNILSGTASLKIYPVPSAGDFFIEYYLASSAEVTLELFSYDGRKIFNIQNEMQPLGLVRKVCSYVLAEGVYLLKVSAGEHSVFRKVVITR